MKRKSTACRIVQVLFLAAIVMLLPVAVWAQETTLTTTVPSSHTLHLVLTGEGTVLVDGVAYTKTVDAQVQRQHRPEISVLATDGSEIKTILWDSEDVTAAFQNGKWTAPEILNDAVLIITFEKIGGTPQTGDTACPELWFGLLIISMFGLITCLLDSKKKRA